VVVAFHGQNLAKIAKTNFEKIECEILGGVAVSDFR